MEKRSDKMIWYLHLKSFLCSLLCGNDCVWNIQIILWVSFFLFRLKQEKVQFRRSFLPFVFVLCAFCLLLVTIDIRDVYCYVPMHLLTSIVILNHEQTRGEKIFKRFFLLWYFGRERLKFTVCKLDYDFSVSGV